MIDKISNNCMHIGLRVKDYEATMDFYNKGLGFEEVFTFKKEKLYKMLEEAGNTVPDKSDADDIWLTYLRIKNEQYLELFPVPREEVSQFNDQSFFHFSLQVDDINAAVAELRKRGINVYSLHIDAINDNPASEKFVPIKALCNSYIAWLKDPDGNLIELMELTNESLQKGCDI